MMYLLIYIIIGLIISAIEVIEFNNGIRKRDESEKDKDIARVLSMFFVPMFCVPLWPMLLTLVLIKVVRRK
jgi:uncharacterized membrane protein